MSIVEPLLALQEIDARIRVLQRESRDIPIRKEEEKGRLRGALASLAETQANLKAALARVDEAELDVKDCKERITKLRQQQVTLKTNKEFAAMNLEVATIEGKIETVEARQIAAMDQVTAARALVSESERRLKEEQAAVDGYVQELDGRLAVVASELKEAEVARQAAVQRVPPAFMVSYNRLIERRWPPVVALEGTSCGGCHLMQPPSVPHAVRRNNSLVACQSCGRILHAPA